MRGKFGECWSTALASSVCAIRFPLFWFPMNRTACAEGWIVLLADILLVIERLFYEEFANFRTSEC